MDFIQSSQNNTIKEIKSLQLRKNRDSKGLYFIEGTRFISEALNSGENIEKIIISEKLEDSNKDLIQKIQDRKISCSLVSDKLFAELTDTKTPQGILSVIKKKNYDYNDIVSRGSFIVLLENLQDPGNAGTIIRTADAANASAVILSKGCVDIYSPKVLRSTMGSVFHIPIIEGMNINEAVSDLKSSKYKIIVSHLKGTNNYFEENLKQKCAIIVGNEANGVSEETSALADSLVKIPMPGRAESLNASVAASIMIYEMVRQRA
jgi:TrmH family RNA methyltransferase